MNRSHLFSSAVAFCGLSILCILSLLGAYQLSLADGVLFHQRHSSPLNIFTTETLSIEALLQPTVKEEIFVGKKFVIVFNIAR